MLHMLKWLRHMCLHLRYHRTLCSLLLMMMLVCGFLLMDRQRLQYTWSRYRLVLTARQTCSPRTNIAFLKNHKCASTAIQNILFRYGHKHNLHFALPEKGNFFGDGLESFRAEMVFSFILNKLQPNIFAIHTKWNHMEVRKVMPADTVYFTVVREPVALFESFYAFARAKKKTGLTLKQYIREVAADGERKGCFGYNTMAWDFGMPTERLNNLTAVSEMVMQADEQFGLVMVVERMEESLVLLAEYLCWELSDVLALDLNSLRKKFKKPLKQETRNILQEKLAPDYLIYRHFLNKFDQQVKAYGRDRMAAAVSRLREMMTLLMDNCRFVRKAATQLTGKQRPSSKKVEGFKAEESSVCSLYSLPELSYLSLLKQKQRKDVFAKFGPPTRRFPKPGHSEVDGREDKGEKRGTSVQDVISVHDDDAEAAIGEKIKETAQATSERNALEAVEALVREGG